MTICRKYFKFIVDVSVTIILWIYFTLGFVIFFSPFYGAAYLFSKERQRSFQKLNHRFLKGFLWLLRRITPGLTLYFDERILDLQACVIVSNHRSYLDPLIMITLFDKQSTIVKSNFFHVPVFGWIVKTAGYLPSNRSGNLGALLIRRVKHMRDYLLGGGVLFVFPEGTRSRDGRIGQFNKGAFKLARRCNVPIEVLCITNTDKLFTPGRFLFNTCVDNRIEVRWIGRISPEKNYQTPVDETMIKAREMIENHLKTRSA